MGPPASGGAGGTCSKIWVGAVGLQAPMKNAAHAANVEPRTCIVSIIPDEGGTGLIAARNLALAVEASSCWMPAVELGSILDRDSGGPRGRDLNVRVKVPSRALGRAEGWDVAVPLQLDVDGARVARAVSPHDKGRHVKLNLPKVLPSGAVLRLRGQGEAKTDGAHGDLYVHVEVHDPKWPAIVVMVVAFLAGAAAAAFALR